MPISPAGARGRAAGADALAVVHTSNNPPIMGHGRRAGDAVPLRFTADGHTGLDVLHTNSPFSRKVDCETLRVPSQGEFITPRELPVATQTPGNSNLTVSSSGVYTCPWKTLAQWAGTCRELVLTRAGGVQHRSFFGFSQNEAHERFRANRLLFDNGLGR